MHISEGVLSPAVLGGGAALAAVGTAIGLKKIDYEAIPRVAILSAAFFVASLIHLPVGPSSVHLLLNGLMGLLLGWPAFPAILIGLFLQTVLFQFGGLTVLGVNTVTVALPAVFCFALCRPSLARGGTLALASAFVCGFLTVFLTACLTATALWLSGEVFRSAAKLVILAHLPVMVVEGLVSLFIYAFLKKVRPEFLQEIYLTNVAG